MMDVRPTRSGVPYSGRLQSPYKGIPVAPPPIKMAEHPHSGSSKRGQVPPEGISGSARRPSCPHKKTDFRHALWVKERKALRDKARKTRFRVEMGKQPKGNTVTVDTSKARSNLDVLRLCVQELGWREYPTGKRDGHQCDIHWHSAHYSENTELYTGWVNKFPGMVDVVKKVSLTRILDIMRNLFPEDYDFHPQSWYLPQQFAEFSDAARRAGAGSKNAKRRPYYIVKPDEGSQGEGIYLITDPKDYTFNNRQNVVQEYLAHPLLIDDLKFDLRIYVVVVRLDPLKIYLHSEGLARFCTKAYQQPSHKNIYEHYMHLTNYSLNKKSSTYVHTDTDDDGSKRTMSSVMKKLDYMGYDVSKLESDIEKLVVKTVLAIAPELKVEMNAAIPLGKPGPKCFQILGFDILITDQMKPMLLEVNANPSLRIDYEHELGGGIFEYLHSPVDEEIKKSLVLSTLKTVAPKKRRRRSHNKLRRSSSANNLTNNQPAADIDSPSDGGGQCKSEAESNPTKVTNKNTAREKEEERVPNKNTDGVRRHYSDVGARAAVKPDSSKSRRLAGKKPQQTRQSSHHADELNNNNAHTENDQENVDPAGEDGDVDEDEDEDYEDQEPAPLQGPDYNPFDNHELKEIYPDVYGEQYEELLIMDRPGDIFLSCLGVRGALRMGATSFRNFTRKGKLSGIGLNNAALDILFIDLQRRWEYTNSGNSSGLCYQGFLEAFFLIARRMFPSETPLDSVRRFLHHCSDNVDNANNRADTALINSGVDQRSATMLTRHPTYLPRLPRSTSTVRADPGMRGSAEDPYGNISGRSYSERNARRNNTQHHQQQIDIHDLSTNMTPSYPHADMRNSSSSSSAGGGGGEAVRLPSSKRYLHAKLSFVDSKE